MNKRIGQNKNASNQNQILIPVSSDGWGALSGKGHEGWLFQNRKRYRWETVIHMEIAYLPPQAREVFKSPPLEATDDI